MRLRNAIARIEPTTTPLVVFCLFYIVTLAVPALLLPAPSPETWQLAALAASAVATFATKRWRKDPFSRSGLSGGGLVAAHELALGLAIGSVAILTADGILSATGSITRLPGAGASIREVAILFVAAALHEELVFRGLPFSQLERIGRLPAVVITSVLFAIFHLGNTAVSPIAVLNLLIAGWMLAEARVAFDRLWLPIGIHFAWNAVSGPFLGHEVSGYRPSTHYVTVDQGADWLTGGAFGLEGSIVVTAVQMILIVLLRWIWRRRQDGRE